MEKAFKLSIRKQNIMQKINLDSVKSIYDLIKGTSKTIEIDLTDKQ